MSLRVAIAFARVGADQNPNVRAKGADPALPYLRAMTVAFASLRRWNPDISLELVTNNSEGEWSHSKSLRALGVATRHVPFDHAPPAGYYNTFAASLYMLDALQSSPEADTLYLDPDIVCLRPLAPMISSLGETVGVLEMKYKPDHNINGLTRTEAGELHALLGERPGIPHHYGGEFYFIPSRWAEPVRERSERAWRFSLERHAAGLSRFTTEEHILSFALRGVPITATSEIRRIWTAARYRTVTGRESGLSLWHLPAEKDRGFARVYPDALDRSSWFWQSDQLAFAREVGKAMGLHHRSPGRFAKDLSGRLLAASTKSLVGKRK